jgi:hypothetical protein
MFKNKVLKMFFTKGLLKIKTLKKFRINPLELIPNFEAVSSSIDSKIAEATSSSPS